MLRIVSGFKYLHSVGLLEASFRLPDEICVIGSLWGRWGRLIQMLNEITGLSGSQERDYRPEHLFALRAWI